MGKPKFKTGTKRPPPGSFLGGGLVQTDTKTDIDTKFVGYFSLMISFQGNRMENIYGFCGGGVERV